MTSPPSTGMRTGMTPPSKYKPHAAAATLVRVLDPCGYSDVTRSCSFLERALRAKGFKTEWRSYASEMPLFDPATELSNGPIIIAPTWDEARLFPLIRHFLPHRSMWMVLKPDYIFNAALKEFAPHVEAIAPISLTAAWYHLHPEPSGEPPLLHMRTA